jgi:hypothetical protein
MTTGTERTLSEQWNPLLAQLEGAAAMGDACSKLVLQSLVAQAANVLRKLMAENRQLREDAADEPAISDLCEDCNERPITGLDARCDTCRENANERAYDRSMEEPTYRGTEAASALAESQARIQRELK